MSTSRAEPALEVPRINSTAGLEHLFGGIEVGPASPIAATVAQAVAYLRVSTPRQLHTASDIDEDGNSIATQRVETMRKVKELKATIVREFVEPGQSAQTITKRTEFKKLLRYLDDHPEVRYVVIYMRSRVFRNFTDAAITKRQLLEKGVRLISAKEEFGEGYMADAMEAITDVMNEVQVRMNGEDVRVKMAHKVEQGGSVGRAKLGYLNVRKDFGGRLVNTIDVDPARAELISWGFEQYATGQYSISQLRELLEEQGLTTRASPSRPERPLSNSRLAQILRDPYYTGVIRYKGKLYGGRHDPIVSKETFVRVQEVLNQRNRTGDRDIIHLHYMKGILICGECRDEGRRTRLLYSQNSGNGGTYEYFICAAKQRRLCTTPAIRIEAIEAELESVIDAERMSLHEIEEIRERVRITVAELLAAETEAKRHLQQQLSKLEAQEERLIELAASGSSAMPKILARLETTTMERQAVTERLARTAERLRFGAEKAMAYLDLLQNPVELFRRASDEVRRDLLGALFAKLVVYVEDDSIRVESERSETNESVRGISSDEAADGLENAKTPRVTSGSGKNKNRGSSSTGRGLSNYYVAGVPGLEPRITVPETVVLPITPYPMAGSRSAGRRQL